jgi:hypothetical protein
MDTKMQDSFTDLPVPETWQELETASNGNSGGIPNGGHETVSPITPKPNGAAFGPGQPSTHSRQIDPFDPKNHKKLQDPRLNPDAFASVAALPNTIYVGKPKKSWFCRFQPDPAYRTVLRLYSDDDAKRRDHNPYLFAPDLELPPDLEGLVTETLVVAAINSAGVPFLYMLNVNSSSWYESGLEVIQRGMEQWIRVFSGDGCYHTKPPISKLDEPRFPEAPFRDWIEHGFAKTLFKSLDDPRVKKLRGAR